MEVTGILMKSIPPNYWLEESDFINNTLSLISLFVITGLCKSKTEVRHLEEQSGLGILVGEDEIGLCLQLHRGKKKVARVYGWESFLEKVVKI